MTVVETVVVVAALAFAPVSGIVLLWFAFRWHREARAETWEDTGDDWEDCVRSHAEALERRKAFRLVRGQGEGGSPTA